VGIWIGTRIGLVYPAGRLIFLLSFLILAVAGWIGYLGLRPRPAEPARRGALGARRIACITPVAFGVGLVSGFFAIGGGFLVVPALALTAAADLRTAGRASLVPIAAFAGLDAIAYALAGDVSYAPGGIMIAAGLAGGAVGIALGDRLPLPTIQRIFAMFLAAIAAYMIAQHL
jgi:uncharacterized membrane protein YfcA